MASFECKSRLIPEVYTSGALQNPAESATATTRFPWRNLSIKEASHSIKLCIGFQSKILNSVLLSKYLQDYSKKPLEPSCSYLPPLPEHLDLSCALSEDTQSWVSGNLLPSFPRPAGSPSSVAQRG